VLRSFLEHESNLVNVKVGLGNGGEENSPRRDAPSNLRSEKESLSQVDVKDAFPHDHVQHEAVEDPSHQDVAEETVPIRRVLDIDVADGQDVELLRIAAAGSIDGEERGPGHAKTNEADGGTYAQEPKEQVAIERLGSEGMRIWDLPK
jgi:hypothetical protein